MTPKRPDETTKKRPAEPRAAADPLVTCVAEVGKGAVASAAVYVLFRLGEAATEVLSRTIPLTADGPSAFLASLLSWGGAFAAGALWLVVTVNQLLTLNKQLKERRSPRV